MKKIVRLALMALVALVVLSGCKESVPSDIIQPDEMAEVLYDYHLADAMASNMKGDRSFNMVALREAALRKHDISQAQFDSSMVYYNRHADLLHDIYQDVVDRMSEQARKEGAQVAVTDGGVAKGDTLDVWRGARSLVLIDRAPYNVFSFSQPTDSAFRKGDGVIWNFDTNFIFQDGSRDGVAVLAVTLGNDSVVSRSLHISSPSNYQLTIDDNDSLRIKSLRGFFILNKGTQDASQTTLKLMAVSNIRLVRKRTTLKRPLPGAAPANGAAPATNGAAPNTNGATPQGQQPQQLQQAPPTMPNGQTVPSAEADRASSLPMEAQTRAR